MTDADKETSPDTMLLPTRGNLRHYPLGKVLGNFFYIGDKPFGVEPGFLAVKIDKALILRLHTAGVLSGDDKDEADNIDASNTTGLSNFLKTKMEALHVLVDKEVLKKQEPEKNILEKKTDDDNDNNIKKNKLRPVKRLLKNEQIESEEEYNDKKEKLLKLGEVIGDLNREGRDPSSTKVKLWLVKQDYNDDRPYPPDDRLAKTNAVNGNRAKLELYRLHKQRPGWPGEHSREEKENINALLETLGNEVAGLVVTAQTQELYRKEGKTPTENKRLVTACLWNKELEMFTDCLAGKIAQKYYVQVKRGQDRKPSLDESGKPILHKNEQGLYVSDNTIEGLGESAAMMLLLGDNDTVGSQGQNKGRVGNQFFGLDFGHAFRDKKNPLVANMRSDLGFNGHKSFKNMSTLFYDTELSERMQGMFHLYKIMGEDKRSEIFGKEGCPERNSINDAIRSYEERYPKFKIKMSEVKDGELINTFQKYKDQIESWKKEETQNPEQYDKYLNAIKTAEETAMASLVIMGNTMKERMQLGPDEVDLLQNLERLCSKTSNTSSDGRCLLKHLRIDDPKHRIEWTMSKSGETITLSNNAPKEEQQRLTELLKKYIVSSNLNSQLNITNVEGRLTLTFNSQNLPKVVNDFQEDIIKVLKPLHAPELDLTPENAKETVKKTASDKIVAGMPKEPTKPSPLLVHASRPKERTNAHSTNKPVSSNNESLIAKIKALLLDQNRAGPIANSSNEASAISGEEHGNVNSTTLIKELAKAYDLRAGPSSNLHYGEGELNNTVSTTRTEEEAARAAIYALGLNKLKTDSITISGGSLEQRVAACEAAFEIGFTQVRYDDLTKDITDAHAAPTNLKPRLEALLKNHPELQTQKNSNPGWIDSKVKQGSPEFRQRTRAATAPVDTAKTAPAA